MPPSPYMLPRLLRHRLSLLRCPAGFGKQCFYRRNPGKGLGADVKPFKFKHKGKNYEYLYIEAVKGLIEVCMSPFRSPKRTTGRA
jgi:bifunctional non-homologous end joining protein LigD